MIEALVIFGVLATIILGATFYVAKFLENESD